jgi:hypothetical protein
MGGRSRLTRELLVDGFTTAIEPRLAHSQWLPVDGDLSFMHFGDALLHKPSFVFSGGCQLYPWLR